MTNKGGCTNKGTDYLKKKDTNKQPILNYSYCVACDGTVHIDELGGFVNVDGKIKIIHNRVDCLMWLAKQKERENK